MESTIAQSYLITGKSQAARDATRMILKNRGINLDKISPDIFLISPLKNHITIDQIREIKSHIAQKPVAEKYKVIILENAQKLTTEAQNALLKLLEEPPKSATIILEAASKFTLLTTILSRVVTIEAKPPKENSEELILFKAGVIESIPQISDPQTWLDSQIISLYNFLLEKIARSKYDIDLKIIIQTIEKCAFSKEMIKANVNPKFVLANLLLWTSSHRSLSGFTA